MMGSSEEVVCLPPANHGMKWFIEGKHERKPCTVSGLIVRNSQVVGIIVIPHSFPKEIRFDANEDGEFPGLWHEDSKQGNKP